MPNVQTANVMVAIAGHKGNTVSKHGVTAAEIAVLRLIHGDDSVTEIQPTGEVKRSHREELERLRERYGRIEGERFVSPAVNALFPGAAARVFERLDELDIPTDFYKAKSRMSSDDEARQARLNEPNNDIDVRDREGDASAGGDEPSDGIGDMPDGKLFE